MDKDYGMDKDMGPRGDAGGTAGGVASQNGMDESDRRLV